MQVGESEKREQVFIHLRRLKSYQMFFLVCLFVCFLVHKEIYSDISKKYLC